MIDRGYVIFPVDFFLGGEGGKRASVCFCVWCLYSEANVMLEREEKATGSNRRERQGVVHGETSKKTKSES